MTRLRAIAVLPALLALAGCGNSLMPTPVGLERSGGDPFSRTTPASRGDDVRVFVATNRTVDGGTSPARYFGDGRDDWIRLGTLDVRFGGGELPWDRLVEVSREPGRQDAPAVALAKIDDFGPVWSAAIMIRAEGSEVGVDEAVRQRFEREVGAAFEASGSRELYVFVHGFNTSVDENASVSASMFHYLGRAGAFIQFEWPSRDSVWSYHADKAAATASVRSFRHFLQYVGTRTGAERVHVLAHSAGAPIAIEAIHELRLMQAMRPAEEVRRNLRLGQLVLVAPDMDLDEFRDCVADGTTQVPERTTLYVSSRDKALDFSAWMAGFARLGQPLEELTPRRVEFLEDDANVDIVDVVGAETRVGSWLGHSYFHEDPWVSTDVLLTLATGAHPLDRGLQRDGERKVFAFGKQYPDRARAAAIKVLNGRQPEATATAAPATAPAPDRAEEKATKEAAP